jgi:hypothetical protein
MIDLHPENILIGFGSSNLSVEQVLALEASPDVNPTLSTEYEIQGFSKVHRVYLSQPLRLAEGKSFSINELIIKIADLGKGTSSRILNNR